MGIQEITSRGLHQHPMYLTMTSIDLDCKFALVYISLYSYPLQLYHLRYKYNVAIAARYYVKVFVYVDIPSSIPSMTHSKCLHQSRPVLPLHLSLQPGQLIYLARKLIEVEILYNTELLTVLTHYEMEKIGVTTPLVKKASEQGKNSSNNNVVEVYSNPQCSIQNTENAGKVGSELRGENRYILQYLLAGCFVKSIPR